MRVLFIPFSRASHLFFVAPLAWACRAAGHDVRIAVQPALTDATVGVGLTAVEVGAKPLEAASRAKGGERVTPGGLAKASASEQQRLMDIRFAPLVDMATAIAPDLLRFAERWRPELVITDPLVFAAPLVSATLDVPLLRHLTGPDIMHRTSNPMHGPMTGNEFGPNWPAGLADLYEGYGLAVHNDYSLGSIDPWPGSLQVPDAPARLPVRFVPYNGTATTPGWALERTGRPTVCLSWGEAALAGDASVPSRILGALASRDVEVVVTGSGIDPARLDRLPENARLAADAPLHTLLPASDAVISQGATHTILTAASFGVPQVLMPQTAATPADAANFCASGAGITLDADSPDTDAIVSAVTATLTNEDIRASARKVREEIAGAPSPADLVHTLEDLA